MPKQLRQLLDSYCPFWANFVDKIFNRN
jgi:hypothetical protein